MAYKLKPEDVERAAGLYDKLAASFKATHIEVMQAVLLDYLERHAERGVFVVEWKPIETAPKDGTVVWVDVAARSEGVQEELPAFQTCCAYHPDAGWCADELREVTHWMPLLPEPKP